MAIDAEELVIHTFRDVVEKGKEAVGNAEAAEDGDDGVKTKLLKAAQGITKEGERALKRLQPLWDGQVEKYGDAFKEQILQHEELGEAQRKLEELLYDFEDFIEPSTFEEDKFSQLQSSTRAFALVVIEVIKRMKVDVPEPAPPALPPMPALPALPPLPPLPALPRGGPRANGKPVKPPPRPPTREKETRPALSIWPSTVPRKAPVSQAPPSRELPTPPRSEDAESIEKPEPPMRNPERISPRNSQRSSFRQADVQLPPLTSGVSPSDFPKPLFTAEFREVESPAASTNDQVLPLCEARRASTPDILGMESEQVRIITAPIRLREDPASAPTAPTLIIPRTSAWVSDQVAGDSPRYRPSRATIPENEAVSGDGSVDYSAQAQLHRNTAHSSGYYPLSLFDPVSPDTPSNRTSTFSHANSTTSSISHSHLFASAVPEALPRSTEPTTSPSNPSAQDFDTGLMLADEHTTFEAPRNAPASEPPRDADCSIGPKSSLLQMRGFCGGAKMFKEGGHWQGIVKVDNASAADSSMASDMFFATMLDTPDTIGTGPMGKCVECAYAHRHSDIIQDMDRNAVATQTKSGVNFRMRLLYKSHLVTTKMTESCYGCVFCAQMGSTVREGDATVFASVDQLFRHLSRHPQPLPQIEGLKVLYGELAPENPDVNDFDLHFPEAPRPSAIPESVRISTLPVATASKTHIRFGDRRSTTPLDGLDLLHFMAGARIVGVQFLPSWAGKWCSGWHDGEFGAFPSKMAQIDPPRRGEAPLPDTRSLKVVKMRWKWDPKDTKSSGWLSLDKGDTVSNVSWHSEDSWCWSGTNSKGKFGYFPRSHADTDTLRDDFSSASKPMKSKPSLRAGRLFGRRPLSSSGGSSMSGSTISEAY